MIITNADLQFRPLVDNRWDDIDGATPSFSNISLSVGAIIQVRAQYTTDTAPTSGNLYIRIGAFISNGYNLESAPTNLPPAPYLTIYYDSASLTAGVYYPLTFTGDLSFKNGDFYIKWEVFGPGIKWTIKGTMMLMEDYNGYQVSLAANMRKLLYTSINNDTPLSITNANALNDDCVYTSTNKHLRFTLFYIDDSLSPSTPSNWVIGKAKATSKQHRFYYERLSSDNGCMMPTNASDFWTFENPVHPEDTNPSISAYDDLRVTYRAVLHSSIDYSPGTPPPTPFKTAFQITIIRVSNSTINIVPLVDYDFSIDQTPEPGATPGTDGIAVVPAYFPKPTGFEPINIGEFSGRQDQIADIESVTDIDSPVCPFGGYINTFDITFRIKKESIQFGADYYAIIVPYWNDTDYTVTPDAPIERSVSFIKYLGKANKPPYLKPPAMYSFLTDFVSFLPNRCAVKPLERLSSGVILWTQAFDLNNPFTTFINALTSIEITTYSDSGGERQIYDRVLVTKNASNEFSSSNSNVRLIVNNSGYPYVRIDYKFRVRSDANAKSLSTYDLINNVTKVTPTGNQDWQGRNVTIEYKYNLFYNIEVTYQDVLYVNQYLTVGTIEDGTSVMQPLEFIGYDFPQNVKALCTTDLGFRALSKALEDDGSPVLYPDDATNLDYFLAEVNKYPYSNSTVAEFESTTANSSLVPVVQNTPIINTDQYYTIVSDYQATATINSEDYLETGKSYMFTALKKKKFGLPEIYPNNTIRTYDFNDSNIDYFRQELTSSSGWVIMILDTLNDVYAPGSNSADGMSIEYRDHSPIVTGNTNSAIRKYMEYIPVPAGWQQ